MSVFKIYDKELHLNRAMALLKSNSETDHIYACLELRFCIEAIVYQKLLHGIDGLPNSIIETWQPNKALKMLTEFDSLTGSNCVVEINLSNAKEPPKDGWLFLGEQKLPPVRWLNKNYNKLGSFLHLVEPKKAAVADSTDVISEVLKIAEQLKKYINTNFLISFKGVDIRKCPVCEQDIAFSLLKVKDGEVRKCSNHRCRALFTVKVDKTNNKVTFNCNTYDIKCQCCNGSIIIPESTIRNLDVFDCGSCGSKYLPRGNYEFALLPNKS